MKDLDLNDLRAFVRVVDRGGFASAARELGLPTSTVSRAVARLESQTATRLLHRTSRSVQLTIEGSAIYSRVSEAVAALERATLALEPTDRRPSGVLRVTAPTDIGCTVLADVAVAFGERHPLVQLDLALTNRAVSLVGERFDVAVRAVTRLEDSSLVVKRLGNVEQALYASPGYVERYGAPSAPADLGRHRCIVFRGKALAKTWKLRAHEETIEVAVRGHMTADDFGYVRASVLAGGGVALMPAVGLRKGRGSGAARPSVADLQRKRRRLVHSLSLGRPPPDARRRLPRLRRRCLRGDVLGAPIAPVRAEAAAGRRRFRYFGTRPTFPSRVPK